MQALCRPAPLPTHHAARSIRHDGRWSPPRLNAGTRKELDRCDIDGDDVDSAVASGRRIALDNLGGNLGGEPRRCQRRPKIDPVSAMALTYSGLMGSVKQVQVTFDCANPRAVAEFWKAVLGYVDPPVPPGFDSWDAFDASLPVESQGSTWVCQDPGGVGPRLFFQRVPEVKTVKNRLHLDVRVVVGLTGDERVSALEAEAARLETLGAQRLRLLPADKENEACLVMLDVEGNEFCLD